MLFRPHYVAFANNVYCDSEIVSDEIFIFSHACNEAHSREILYDVSLQLSLFRTRRI